MAFSETSFGNDDMVKFYTRLPNLIVLKAVFAFVHKSLPSSWQSTNKLSNFQEFVATLVKLRLNSQVQDLAYRLDVSSATLSRTLLKWLTAMDATLGKGQGGRPPPPQCRGKRGRSPPKICFFNLHTVHVHAYVN